MTTTPAPLPTTSVPVAGVAARLALLARDIKLSHSVFALPWALLATALAAHRTRPGGWPAIGQVSLIVACMVLARTVAMAANRVLDARLDALNPRTARRAVASGRLPAGFVYGVVAVGSLAFVGVAALFVPLYDNRLPLIWSVPVLLFVCAYPFLKRFTRWCHYYLGVALALAPVCAWAAVAGEVGWPALGMAAAVVLWTAGFDVLYACQDYASDVATGVHSVPARLGVRGAFAVARLTHVGCVAALVALAWQTPEFGGLFGVGVGVTAVLLVVEHTLVRPDDLSKMNAAFFTVNGVISVLIGVLGVVDVYF